MESSSVQAAWEEDETAYLATLQLLSHHGLAMSVKAAIELDIFDILASAGPAAQLSAFDIAAQIPNCNPTTTASRLDRLLRFLASNAILNCASSLTRADGNVQRLYSLEPIYHHLTKNQDGVSLAPAFLFLRAKPSFDSWQYLKDAVLEDIDPFAKANGLKFFEYMAKNPIAGELFNQCMASVNKLMWEKILNAYKGFDEELTVLVDAGGGVGAMIGMIIYKHPHIKGINFDLPHIVSNSPYIPGVEHVAGDIFLSIPNGDVILLKSILHDWSDEECLKILKNCYKALPVRGKVVVVERIVPEIPERNDAVREVYFTDLLMMVSCHRAKERSEKEFRALATEAGFSNFKIACCVMNFHVIEIFK